MRSHTFFVSTTPLGNCDRFLLQSKSNRSSVFVNADLNAVSMSSRLERYLVLIAGNFEKADSQTYIETSSNE